MSDDSSPWVPDKPPPSKLPDEYLKEEIKSARNGLGGFLMIGFAIGRNIQVFSRVPGTAGIYLIAAWPAGAFLCGFYLLGHAEKYGQIDQLSPIWLFFIQNVLWTTGVFATCWNAGRGRRIANQGLGSGLLFRSSTRLSKRAAGVLSDLVIGVILVISLFAFESPVQGNCYAVILGWLMACHFCVFFRDWLYRKRLRETRERARNWHKDVRGRHHL